MDNAKQCTITTLNMYEKLFKPQELKNLFDWMIQKTQKEEISSIGQKKKEFQKSEKRKDYCR